MTWFWRWILLMLVTWLMNDAAQRRSSAPLSFWEAGGGGRPWKIFACRPDTGKTPLTILGEANRRFLPGIWNDFFLFLLGSGLHDHYDLSFCHLIFLRSWWTTWRGQIKAIVLWLWFNYAPWDSSWLCNCFLPAVATLWNSENVAGTSLTLETDGPISSFLVFRVYIFLYWLYVFPF